MITKIIASLITLSAINLLSHDNFNQISTNAGSRGLDSSHLKINHQSYFYLPNEDGLVLDLTHALHLRHIQNDMGLAYRKAFEGLGIGANFYYMHTTKPRAFVHQFSPGIELVWKDFQFSYNLYLPATKERTLKKQVFTYSTASEFGIRWMPRKEIDIGLLPFYNHSNKNWGLNTRINYILKETFVFGVSPYFKPSGSGCVFSFGVNFGPVRDMKSTHRSNEFNYSVKDCSSAKPKISVESRPAVSPATTPNPVYPFPGRPSDITDSKGVQAAPAAVPKEQPKEVKKDGAEGSTWWPFPLNETKPGEAKPQEQKKVDGKPIAANKTALDDLFFIPPFEEIHHRG